LPASRHVDLYGFYIAAAPNPISNLYAISPTYVPFSREFALMLDAIFVAAGFGVFFLGVMYVFACDRL
jgi:hypothetical protein